MDVGGAGGADIMVWLMLVKQDQLMVSLSGAQVRYKQLPGMVYCSRIGPGLSPEEEVDFILH